MTRTFLRHLTHKAHTMDALHLLVLAIIISSVHSQDNLQYSISEDTEQFVANLKTDIGLVENGQKFILLDTEYKSLFNLNDSTGMLSSMVIDREEFCEGEISCVMNLEVNVLVGGTSRKLEQIQITINDDNDHIPKFPSSEFSATLREDSSVGISFNIPRANDPDSPANGIDGYTLTTPDPAFRLKVQSNDLYLELTEALDREQKHLYILEVEAYEKDNPGRKGVMKVNITILDTNDNRPVFTNETYTKSIREDTPVGQSILRVQAIDKDHGDNAKLVYAFADRTDARVFEQFEINNITGDIKLKSELDFEENQQYNLYVTAKETQPGHLPTEAVVQIKVLNVNDQPPKITVNALTASGLLEIPEDANIGSNIAKIKVNDPDGDVNGRLECSLDLTSTTFRLDRIDPTPKPTESVEYYLVTSAALDREENSVYDLGFSCEDNGIPNKQSRNVLRVTILDKNDHSPVFSDQVYDIEISENNPGGVFLHQIKATDNDDGENARISYQFSNNAENYISFDPDSGNITAKKPFDYEQKPSFTFQITATDNGEEPRSSSATVHIRILDVNDEAPVFLLDSYSLNVYEEESIGTEVGKVQAVDHDSAKYNLFTFSFEPSLAALETFAIEPESGRIFTRQKLDRETKDEYELVAVATDKIDSDLRNSVNVKINVIDKNDHSPVFDYPNPENDTVQTYLHPHVNLPQIRAHDDDIGLNAKLNYYIQSGDTDNLFFIDESTGYLYMHHENAENEDAQYQLTLLVVDNGDPILSEQAWLNIIVNRTSTQTNLPVSVSDKQNVIIIIVIAIISAIVTTILLIAIVVLKRQDKHQKKKKYLAKLLTEQNGCENRNNNDTDSADGGSSGKKEVSFSNEVCVNDEYPQMYDSFDWNKHQQEHESKANNQQKQPHRVNPNDIYAVVNKKRDVTKDNNILSNQKKPDKDWQLQQYLANIPGEPGDSDSSSEEASNADSGMGSNEDGHLHPNGSSSSGISAKAPSLPPRGMAASTSNNSNQGRTPPMPPSPSKMNRSPAPHYRHHSSNFGQMELTPHQKVSPQRSNSLQYKNSQNSGASCSDNNYPSNHLGVPDPLSNPGIFGNRHKLLYHDQNTGHLRGPGDHSAKYRGENMGSIGASEDEVFYVNSSQV